MERWPRIAEAALQKSIATVEEFYAHALAIEREAATRYAEYSQWFRDRNPEVAQLCRRLEALERDHFQELATACSTLELPEIPANEYRWLQRESPEVRPREIVYGVASTAQLMEIALGAELAAQAFFIWVARTAPLRSVRELASVMAAEEGEHVHWVREALKTTPASG
jgi:rubrerythrin